jgi:hypothetical protein
LCSSCCWGNWAPALHREKIPWGDGNSWQYSGTKAERHLKKLSNWDNETTFSYFEELHPTGIQEVVEYVLVSGTPVSMILSRSRALGWPS